MWTAGWKNYIKVDHRSCVDHRSYRRNFCRCEKKAWKKIRLVRDSNRWLLQIATVDTLLPFYRGMTIKARWCCIPLCISTLHGDNITYHRNQNIPSQTTYGRPEALCLVLRPRGGYSQWWPIRGGSTRKGYLFQASAVQKGRDFTIWSIWKGREICHLRL